MVALVAKQARMKDAERATRGSFPAALGLSLPGGARLPRSAALAPLGAVGALLKASPLAAEVALHEGRKETAEIKANKQKIKSIREER